MRKSWLIGVGTAAVVATTLGSIWWWDRAHDRDTIREAMSLIAADDSTVFVIVPSTPAIGRQNAQELFEITDRAAVAKLAALVEQTSLGRIQPMSPPGVPSYGNTATEIIVARNGETVFSVIINHEHWWIYAASVPDVSWIARPDTDIMVAVIEIARRRGETRDH